MSNPSSDTINAMRRFMREHGANATVLALSEVLKELGDDWHAASETVESVTGFSPHNDDDYKQAIGGRSGKIRIVYSDTKRKIEVIKVVRRALDIGLREAKDYTELANASGVVGDFGVLTALNDEMDRRNLSERFTMD